MSIARATTPTFTCTFTEEDLDLTLANNVYVTFEQGDRVLTKAGENLEIEAKKISVYLSQKETLQFHDGQVEVQANWTMGDDKRAASEVKVIEFSKQLLRKVVE